jgi:hypothetical protein
MHAETFYFDDAQRADFDRSTSIGVIAELAHLNADFISRQPSVAGTPHPGLGAARRAKGGEKLSGDDIRAWDDLVTRHLLPFLDAQAADLDSEKGVSREFERPCALLAASIRSKRMSTARQHAAFMEAFRSLSERRR